MVSGLEDIEHAPIATPALGFPGKATYVDGAAAVATAQIRLIHAGTTLGRLFVTTMWGIHNDALGSELFSKGFISIGWEQMPDLRTIGDDMGRPQHRRQPGGPPLWGRHTRLPSLGRSLSGQGCCGALLLT